MHCAYYCRILIIFLHFLQQGFVVFNVDTSMKDFLKT